MSVLNGVTAAQVTCEPYPHLVAENAIDATLCQRLIDEFPPLDVFTKGRDVGENVKIYYPQHFAVDDSRVSDLWKNFLLEHITPGFYSQVIDIFGDFLRTEYPNFEREVGRTFETLRVGVEGRDEFSDCDVLLGSLLGIHTPVSGAPQLERRPHVKLHDKFMEGFLYLQADDDDADGGDYEFFSVKPGRQPRFGKWAQTDRDDLAVERTVPYGKGTLVLVLNTSRSIQALTPRGAGTRPLMYANFTLRTPRELFDLNYGVFGRAHRILRAAYDRIAAA